MLKGYKNFMKYWAKNGDYTWIDNIYEYSNSASIAGTTGNVKVVYSWGAYNFWVNYDGTVSAIDTMPSGGGKAVGW